MDPATVRLSPGRIGRRGRGRPSTLVSRSSLRFLQVAVIEGSVGDEVVPAPFSELAQVAVVLWHWVTSCGDCGASLAWVPGSRVLVGWMGELAESEVRGLDGVTEAF
jgi:hypothetical protein